MNTPWGETETVEQIAEGIQSVSTPSHGGIVLSAERAAMIPHTIEPFTGDYRFWEEDGDWAVPFLIFTDDMMNWSVARHHGRAISTAHARRAVSWGIPDKLAIIDAAVKTAAAA